MMTALAQPLFRDQIEAANELYDQSQRWRLIDTALAELHRAMSGYEYDATFIKAAAINQTYSTNVYDLHSVAQHVAVVLGRADLTLAGPELVEEMAAVPRQGNKDRRFRSFASKFASVFIDCERFPILDSVADETLRWHLGRGLTETDPVRPYLAFDRSLRTLVRIAGLSCSILVLDRYLWLAGLYRRWRENPDAAINTEARRLFVEDEAAGRRLGRVIWDPS